MTEYGIIDEKIEKYLMEDVSERIAWIQIWNTENFNEEREKERLKNIEYKDYLTELIQKNWWHIEHLCRIYSKEINFEFDWLNLFDAMFCAGVKKEDGIERICNYIVYFCFCRENLLYLFDDSPSQWPYLLTRYEGSIVAKILDKAVNKIFSTEENLVWKWDYYKYLRSDHWQRIRLKTLKRSNYKCQMCGRGKFNIQLHVHHNTYENLGNEKPEDLIVLCKDCHAKFHDK